MNQAAERSAAAKAGASFINVVPWFCAVNSCPATIDNVDVYSDGTHVTATNCIWLETVLSQALGLSAP